MMEKLMRNADVEIGRYVEIVKDSLYFAVLKGTLNKKLRNTSESFFFSIDDELLYQNYYSDFGPLNLSCLYKYCCKLNKYLHYARGLKNVVHYTTSQVDKKANAACLMGCFCVIYLKYTPKEVWTMMEEAGPYKPFLDASQFPFASQFTLKILDCYQAIHKATTFNFFDFEDFNSTEYDLYNKLEFGDMNWLVPRKFLAFIGPTDNRTVHPPEFYIKYFLKNDIKTVIRLNNVLYDSYAFLQVGIQHFDLIFPDGSTPPKDILLKFLYIAETAPAAIAVHCKAGLGRTGSLIGAYIMKHYRISAREAIAWLRFCRPGSVIGQQQVWMEQIQSWLWRTGSQYRVQRFGEGDKIPRHKYGIYSKQWPTDREKIIREARKQIQTTFTKKQLETMAHQQRARSMSADKITEYTQKMYPKNNKSFKSISKLISSVHGVGNGKLLKTSVLEAPQNFFTKHSAAQTNSTTGAKKVTKKSSKSRTEKEKQDKSATQVAKKYIATEIRPTRYCYSESAEPSPSATQGDRLNEIKFLRNNKPRVPDKPSFSRKESH